MSRMRSDSLMNTQADTKVNQAYSKKASAYDKFRAYSPGLTQINQTLSKIPPNLRILDLGCGTGAFFELLISLSPSSISGVDANANMIEQAKIKAHALTGNSDWVSQGTTYDLTSSSYDLIFIRQVIQNLTTDPTVAQSYREKFLREIFRLLVPNGSVMLTTRLVPDNGRWSDLYWYADPEIVPESVKNMESMVPKNPKRELESVGFIDVKQYESFGCDHMIREDAYWLASNLKNSDFRAADSFFQHVDLKGELGLLLDNLDRVESEGRLEEYVKKRGELSKGSGHVATLYAVKPL